MGGQSTAEFALAVPIFLLLLFGTFEVGALLKTHAAYQEATIAAARVGAAAGPDPKADGQILGEFQSMLPAENLTSIGSVTVYDATASSAFYTPPIEALPSGCAGAGPAPCAYDNAHTTYVYDPSSKQFVCAATRQPPPCRSGSYWDPTTRDTTAGKLDHIGITVSYTYTSTSGVLPVLHVMQGSTAVMEPLTYGQ